MEERQHPAESDRRRDGERDREPVEPGERLAGERERHVDREHGGADEGKPGAAPRDEDERERDRQRDRGDHVRGHRHDEPRDLGADVVAVGGAEHARGDLGAGDGEDPRRRRDDEQRRPRRRLDVPRDTPRLETEPGQRHRGDEPDRGGADPDDRGRDQVRVAEARHRADALPRGDREADEVDRLEREGSAAPEPSSRDGAPTRARPRARRRRASARGAPVARARAP